MDEPNGEALTEQLNFGYSKLLVSLDMELLDEITMKFVKDAFTSFMEVQKTDGVVASYSVVCSKENNPPDLVDEECTPSVCIYWTQKDAPTSWVFMVQRGPFYEP